METETNNYNPDRVRLIRRNTIFSAINPLLHYIDTEITTDNFNPDIAQNKINQYQDLLKGIINKFNQRNINLLTTTFQLSDFAKHVLFEIGSLNFNSKKIANKGTFVGTIPTIETRLSITLHDDEKNEVELLITYKLIKGLGLSINITNLNDITETNFNNDSLDLEFIFQAASKKIERQSNKEKLLLTHYDDEKVAQRLRIFDFNKTKFKVFCFNHLATPKQTGRPKGSKTKKTS